LSFELAREAVRLHSNDVYIQDHLGFAYLSKNRWEDAELPFAKTTSKLVNEAQSVAWCSYAYLTLGQAERARELVLEANRLDPLQPHTFDWIVGQVHFFGEQCEEACRALRGEALLNSLAHACVTPAYAHLNRMDEAGAALNVFVSKRRRELNSRKFPAKENTVSVLAGGYRQMWRRQSDWNQIANGLRKAGLPS